MSLPRARCLYRCDVIEHALESRCHLLVHRCGIVAGHEVRLPAVTRQQALELAAGDARENRGVRDLVTIQVEDRQHRAIGGGVQEFVRMPGSRQRAGFRLAVTDHTGDNEIRIVECRAEGVR